MENSMTELQMQAQCATWFWNTFPAERRMLHCNMNNSFNRIAGASAKALGVIKGISDMELIVRGAVIFIEFKVGEGKQSDEQIDFMNKVDQRGHSYIIIRSFGEFKLLIYGALGNS